MTSRHSIIHFLNLFRNKSGQNLEELCGNKVLTWDAPQLEVASISMNVTVMGMTSPTSWFRTQGISSSITWVAFTPSTNRVYNIYIYNIHMICISTFAHTYICIYYVVHICHYMYTYHIWICNGFVYTFCLYSHMCISYIMIVFKKFYEFLIKQEKHI